MEDKRVSEIAYRLAAIATAGKFYAKNDFDKEHYENILELSKELLTIGTDITPEHAEDILEGMYGYQTPKVETRVIIFNENDQILLVRDFDGRWNPPGGWCEHNLSLFDNTKKEALEETGLTVEPYRLAAVFDHRKNNNPNSLFSICKCYILCRDLGGEFVPNIETSETGYFSLDALPEINPHKCNKRELEICLKANKAETWETYFD